MSYAIRNTLILGVLLLIVFFGFLIINTAAKKELSKLDREYKQKKNSLDEIMVTNPYIKDEAQIIDSLETMKKVAYQSSKHIPNSENPTATYQYLLDICDNYCPNFTFDFELVNSGEQDSVYYNIYNLTGLSDISSLYSFINQIENQYFLIVVDNFQLSEYLDPKQDDTDKKQNKIPMIDFNLDLRVYYDYNTGTDPEQIPTKKIEYSTIKYNPFISRIYEPQKDVKEEEYINIYSSVIVGLTKNKVFVRDHTGKISTLLPGGKVAYGYLDHIDWDEQSVIFKMNEIGVITEKIMYIDKEESEL
jgi:hypothetical protein